VKIDGPLRVYPRSQASVCVAADSGLGCFHLEWMDRSGLTWVRHKQGEKIKEIPVVKFSQWLLGTGLASCLEGDTDPVPTEEVNP
jgi:hypothetical protein